MSKFYSGSNIKDFYKGKDQWSYYIPPITPSKYHHVLYKFPATSSSAPLAHTQKNPKHWDADHVKMPYSPENLYPLEENGTKTIVSRWELICKVLEKPIRSFTDLEKAINSYNTSVPLTALENFFVEVLSEEETEEFFENLLPKIIKLALQLPDIVPGSIPLLKKHHNKSVSLSQVQVSSLLANAFLCTFPWRKEVSLTFPGVNFVRLFTSNQRIRYRDCVAEKIKCIMHYFQRITKTEPKGVITFERRFLPRSEVPRWDTLQNNLGNTRVHIVSTGTIEDDGQGFLQIDFANKFVGGGVLGYGCVQEEIRFIICPELLISRLFVEQLDDTEAVIVRGVERFSKYTGYGDSFKWDGNYLDDTPFDNYCRRKTAISIIDATLFFKAETQYHSGAILRELNKAYVGFSSHHTENLAPVATGNWGCGAFNGDVNLKTLIQLMACNAAHRDLVYYTFGNKELEETLYSMYLFIASNRIKTCELWRILCRFAAAKLPTDQFICYIQQCWFDMRDKTEVISNNSSLTQDKCKREEKQSPVMPSKRETSPKENPLHKLKKETINTPTTSKVLPNTQSSTDSEDFIPSSQPDEEYKITPKSKTKKNLVTLNNTNTQSSSSKDVVSSLEPKSFSRLSMKKNKEKTKFNKEFFEKTHNELLNIFSTIDGPPIVNKIKDEEHDTLLSASDKWAKQEKVVKADDVVLDIEEGSMEVDEPQKEVIPTVIKSKNKITDYFSKLGKS